jgi:hypothetical protein
MPHHSLKKITPLTLHPHSIPGSAFLPWSFRDRIVVIAGLCEVLKASPAASDLFLKVNSVCRSYCLLSCLFACLSACLSVSLSVCLYICLPVCLSFITPATLIHMTFTHDVKHMSYHSALRALLTMNSMTPTYLTCLSTPHPTPLHTHTHAHTYTHTHTLFLQVNTDCQKLWSISAKSAFREADFMKVRMGIHYP